MSCYKPLDTLIVFLKEFFEDDKKNMKNYPACKELKVQSNSYHEKLDASDPPSTSYKFSVQAVKALAILQWLTHWFILHMFACLRYKNIG